MPAKRLPDHECMLCHGVVPPSRVVVHGTSGDFRDNGFVCGTHPVADIILSSHGRLYVRIDDTGEEVELD